MTHVALAAGHKARLPEERESIAKRARAALRWLDQAQRQDDSLVCGQSELDRRLVSFTCAVLHSHRRVDCGTMRAQQPGHKPAVA